VGPLLVLMAACGPRKPPAVDFSEVNRPYRAEDYGVVRERWTRHAKLVRDLGTVLEGWATLKSWDWRQAYVEQYAATYNLPESERSELRRAQLESYRQAYEVHAAVQSTKDDWNDLEQKDSPWRVTLIDGSGAEIEPTSIEVLKLPELYEMRFFPYRNDFTRTYLMRFARTNPDPEAKPFRGEATGHLTLRIAGPLGRIDLAWAAPSASKP
jgi:hypothetical protein